MYAIVKTGGKQYTVKAGDVLDVEKLEGAEGDKLDLQVLLVRDGKKTISDPKELAGVKVVAQIVEQHKGDKVLVFKFKKRKGYKRTRGHRQQLTRICIDELNGEKAEAPAKEVKADEAAATGATDKAAAAQDLSKLTVAQLKDLAKERGVKLESGARKADIITAIENA